MTPSATAPSRGPEPPPERTPVAAPPGRATPPEAGSAAQGWPNPSLRLDPALGIVVMEFRDSTGWIAATLPTERELAAYRAAASRPDPAAG